MTSNRVRIIGGEYRSRLLRFPPRPGLRPTPDRVRETVFNWLGQDLEGRRCLDLFAGSGALGFEAASRGARPVFMIERDQRTFQALRCNAGLLRCETAVELRCMDALEFARACHSTFDIVFLDPPYESNLIAALVPMLPKLVSPGGCVYAESAQGVGLEAPWRLHRQSAAGLVTFQLFVHENQ